MLVTNRSISYFDDGDFSNSCVWRPTLLALHVKVKNGRKKEFHVTYLGRYE